MYPTSFVWEEGYHEPARSAFLINPSVFPGTLVISTEAIINRKIFFIIFLAMVSYHILRCTPFVLFHFRDGAKVSYVEYFLQFNNIFLVIELLAFSSCIFLNFFF